MADQEPQKPALKPPRKSIGKAYDVMELYFSAAVLINAVPFTYDRASRRYAVSKDSLKYKIWFVLMFCGMLAECLQATKETIRSKRDSSVNRGEWGLIYFLFISWSFLSTVHFSLYRKTDEIVNHMNQTIRMREWFTENLLPSTNDHQLVKPHIYFSCFQGFFQCLMVAVEGTKKQYLYSNVPLEYRNVFTSGIWAVWAYYRVMTNFLAGYFLIFGGMFHVFTCNQVLSYRAEERVKPEMKLKIYRMLQVLTNRFGQAYSMIFIPQMTIFVAQNMILGIYGTVKFHDELDFANYMNFPLMTVLMMILAYTFYTKNATVYETSKDEKREVLRTLLREAAELSDIKVPSASKGTRGKVMRRVKPVLAWGGRPTQAAMKEAKRVARASPVIGIPFGSLYKIKRTTVLNLFDFIACNAISTLITYP